MPSAPLPHNPDAPPELVDLVTAYSDAAFAGGFLNVGDIVGRKIIPATWTRWTMLQDRPKMLEALKREGWEVLAPRRIQPLMLEQSYDQMTVRQKIAHHRTLIRKLDEQCAARKFKIGLKVFDRAVLLQDPEFARLDAERQTEAGEIKRLNEVLERYRTA